MIFSEKVKQFNELEKFTALVENQETVNLFQNYDAVVYYLIS